RPRPGPLLPERRPPERPPRAAVIADQAQPAAAAGKDVLDQVLEVLRRRGEGGLEALADLAVGVADHERELAHRGFEIAPLGLELVGARERFAVLLAGERIDGTELVAPARDALA